MCAHSGWIRRKELTGAHAGRVQYEVLVACPRMVSLVMPQMILSSLNNRTDQWQIVNYRNSRHIYADSLYLVQSSANKLLLQFVRIKLPPFLSATRYLLETMKQ